MDAMDSLGYSRVRRDGAGNVLGEVGGGARSVLLCGHMDTVPGELPVRRVGSIIHGRGASDAKAPLCALLLAGARSADCGLKVTFAGTTGEETDSSGVRAIAAGGRPFDFALFGEPSGSSRITVGYRGRVGLKVAVSAGGGHAGAPWSAASAFDEFLGLHTRLKEYEAAHSAESRFDSLSVSATLVRAGSSHNVLPPSCEATFDVRVPPRLAARDVARELRSVALASSGRAAVHVEVEEATDAYEAPRSSVLLRALSRAVIITLKRKPALARKTGTGDMNLFAASTGTPCLTYGPGDPETSHSDSERVSSRDYLNAIGVLQEALAQLGRLAGG